MLKRLICGVLLWSAVPMGITANSVLMGALTALEQDGGGREEGSTAEATLITLIERFSGELALIAERFSLHSFNDIHSFSSIITVFFPSTLPASSQTSRAEVVYLFPLESSLAQLMLAFNLMYELSVSPRTVNARIVFLGAETAPLVFDEHSQMRADAYPIGSRSWLRRYSVASDSQLFYFNFASPTHRITIGSSGQSVSPRSGIRAAQQALRTGSATIRLKRGGFLSYTTTELSIDHYLEAGYQAVMIEGADELTTENLDMRQWAAHLAQQLTLLAKQPSLDADPDRNFLIMGEWMMGEKSYLLFLGGIFAALLLVLTAKRRSYRVQRRFLRRNVKHFLYLVPWVFLSLFLSSFIAHDSLIQRNNENLWQFIPFAFVLYKIMLTLLVGTLLSRLLVHVVALHQPRFYTAAAVFFSLINVVVFSLFNILLVIPFLWFFCCVVAFSLSRTRRSRLLWGGVAPIPLLVLGKLWLDPQQSVGFFNLLLFNSFKGNIMLTFMFLPVFLMSTAIVYQRAFLRLYHKHFQSMEWLYGMLALVILGYILTYQPYGRDRLQPIHVVARGQLPDGYGLAYITSTQGLGDVILTINDNRQLLSLGQEPQKNNIFFPLSTQFYLDGTMRIHRGRNMIELTIESDELPSYIDILLQTEERMGVVDANFPIRWIEEAGATPVLRLFIGQNPPNPLAVRITTDPLKQLRVEAHVIFRNPPTIRLERDYGYLNYSVLQLTRTISLS